MGAGAVKKAIFVGWLAFEFVAVYWLAQRVLFYRMTGSFFPISKIEELNNPVGVLGWTNDGLRLADGRLAKVPRISDLPEESVALSEATKRGVEIAANGEMTVLVKLWRWCGNDPVKEDVRRIQLSPYLRCLRVGRSEQRPPLDSLLVSPRGGNFNEYGWNISDFNRYKSMMRDRSNLHEGPWEDPDLRRKRIHGEAFSG